MVSNTFGPEQAFQLVIYLHAASLLLVTLEYLSIIKDFSNEGVYSWKLFRATGATWRTSRRTVLTQNRLFDRTGMRQLLLARIAVVVLMAAFPLMSWAQSFALMISALMSIVLSWRQRYGEDGADQMNLIVSVVCFLAVGPLQGTIGLYAGLGFLALQAVLAYLSAGIAKIISPVWLKGLAVGLIVNTASYGSSGSGAFLKMYPLFGRLATWGTVLFEFSFPLVLLLPWPLVVAPLAVGMVFHMSIALVMGLNNFIPAFLSTYPAVLFVSQVVTS